MIAVRLSKQTTALLAFVFPALLFYAVFVLVPAFGGFWYSLTDWNGLNPTYKMVGFSNYVEALTEDPAFIKAIRFTLKYVVYMVVLQNVFALVLAVLVESLRKTKVWFRTIFFMPNMISMVIAGFMWLFIFTKVLPYVAQHPVFNSLDQSWIGDPTFSFYAILIVSLWVGVGYLMIIYIAALQGVPRQIREAAAIDGANGLQAFYRITLPMILPAITVGVAISLSSSFNLYSCPNYWLT